MSFFKRRNRDVSPNPAAAPTNPLAPPSDEKSGVFTPSPSPSPPPPPFVDSDPPPPFPTRDLRIPTESSTRIMDPSEPDPDGRLPFTSDAGMITYLRTNRIRNPPKTAAKKKLDDVVGVLYGHEYMYDQGHGRRPDEERYLGAQQQQTGPAVDSKGVGASKPVAERRPERLHGFRKWANGYFVDEDCGVPSRWTEAEEKRKGGKK
ncbi:hypothetical protein HDU96_010716 [Phlyctochytrium bullatum]|nr:hypothetical protein HDU96_010716 [Phlyctochytrium bullatum]